MHPLHCLVTRYILWVGVYKVNRNMHCTRTLEHHTQAMSFSSHVTWVEWPPAVSRDLIVQIGHSFHASVTKEILVLLCQCLFDHVHCCMLHKAIHLFSPCSNHTGEIVLWLFIEWMGTYYSHSYRWPLQEFRPGKLDLLEGFMQKSSMTLNIPKQYTYNWDS